MRVISCACFAAFAAFAFHVAAQTPQQPTFRSGTNLVQVDVIVTDASGRPIDDLSIDDFQILDDGSAVPIATFKFVNTANVEKRDRYPVRNGDDEEREAAYDDTRLFAILLDDYHVARFGPLRVVQPLVDFVRALPPTDLVGVFYPLDSPRDIHLTYDRDAVIAAIKKFEGRWHEYMPKHPAEEEQLRYPREIERLRTQVVLSGAVSIASRLGALKIGRKSLVWVTEGFTAYRYDPSGLEKDLREVFDAANRNNVSIYPVDPSGLTMGSSQSRTGLLRALARETGGRAIVNRNDIRAALPQVSRDSIAYYLLGFVSSRGADGKFHHITVRTKRPKLRITARVGYWALTEAEVASARAVPRVVPDAVTQAFKAMAEALRPQGEEAPRAVAHVIDASPTTIMAAPTFALVRGRGSEEPVARPEFLRTQRIVVRARLAGSPPPDVEAQLLDRTGQKLALLPVSIADDRCEIPLSLGSLGAGDYVVQLTARRGAESVHQYVALRVVR